MSLSDKMQFLVLEYTLGCLESINNVVRTPRSSHRIEVVASTQFGKRALNSLLNVQPLDTHLGLLKPS